MQSRSRAAHKQEEEQISDPYISQSLQLLLAAGYFRARVKALSIYDRIVGGLVWCISNASDSESSELQVDLEEIFVEGANIGMLFSKQFSLDFFQNML